MYDLNFFATPITKKEKNQSVLYSIIGMGLIIVLLIGFAVWMQFQFANIRKDTNTMKDYMTSSEVISQLSELTAIKQKQQILNDYSLSLGYIDQYIANNDQVNSSMISKITSAIPQMVTFKSLVLSRTEMMIDGISNDQQSIAEYLKNLKDTNLFSQTELLKVSQITPTESTLSFAIRGVLKNEVQK